MKFCEEAVTFHCDDALWWTKGMQLSMDAALMFVWRKLCVCVWVDNQYNLKHISGTWLRLKNETNDQEHDINSLNFQESGAEAENHHSTTTQRTVAKKVFEIWESPSHWKMWCSENKYSCHFGIKGL